MTNHGINLRGKEPPNKPLSHSHTNDKRSQRSQTYHNTVTSSCLKAISQATTRPRLLVTTTTNANTTQVLTFPCFSSHTSNNKRSQHLNSRCLEPMSQAMKPEATTCHISTTRSISTSATATALVPLSPCFLRLNIK